LRVDFGAEKRTERVRGRSRHAAFGAGEVSGYLLHHGRVTPTRDDTNAPLHIGDAPEGAIAGATLGTMVHGLFESPAVRAGMLGWLRSQSAIEREGAPAAAPSRTRDEIYDALANHVCSALDMTHLRAMLGLA
jgi:cobyric acid synthase